MPRRTKSAHDPKGATDFLTGASESRPSGVDAQKATRSSNTTTSGKISSTQSEHKSVGATGQLASLHAKLLEEVGPLALKQITDVMQDESGKFTPEHKQKLAFQVLSELGVGKQEHGARPDARADLVTLHAVNDRLARILERCDARDVAPDTLAMFG